MYIRKFLLVSCIASVLIIIVWFNKGEIVEVSLINNTYIDVGFNKFKKIVSGLDVDVRRNIEGYLFKLYIPKINLVKEIYDIDSKFNDVDINIELLEASVKDDNLYFLASHSGGGRASYFDDLIYLEKGDVIFLENEYQGLSYVVEEMFYIEKNGYFEVEDIKDMLFLVTCSLSNKREQLVVRAKKLTSDNKILDR